MLKRIIKHIAAVLLLIILPFNTVGVIVYNHICHESGNTISSIYTMESCNMETETDICCPNETKAEGTHYDECCEKEERCEGMAINPADCCNDEVQYISMDIPFIKDNNESVNLTKCIRDFKRIDYKETISKENTEQVSFTLSNAEDLPDIVQIQPILQIPSESEDDHFIS